MSTSNPASPRIVHTGQALVDEVVQVPGLPPRGGNVVAGSLTRWAGGAVNILVAAARSGARAVHAGAHGTGPNGDLVRAALAAEGVALAAPALEGADTGVCLVLVEPSGERTFVTTQGAERQITPATLDLSAPAPGDLVCVTGYSLSGPTRGPLLAWLDGLDPRVLVVLDPGAPFAGLGQALRERVLARTAVWTGNADEARDLGGVAGSGAAAAVARLLPEGAVVVVRDGPRGCVVLAGGRLTELPGFPQEPVDTNGAGDAHTGVLLAGRAAGLDWVEAAVRANVAGALKVTRRGPATAPTAAEIDAFLAGRDGLTPAAGPGPAPAGRP